MMGLFQLSILKLKNCLPLVFEDMPDSDKELGFLFAGGHTYWFGH
ncbi:MAG: hypothetical protein ACI8V2_005312 [Candidatus Latescibacterota bacterium]|jgi:hypothetical protein